MLMSIVDRVVMLFVLEVAWLLCVLQLADTPLLAGIGGPAVACVLCAGGLLLAIALLLAAAQSPRFPVSVQTICRSMGVVLFATGLLAWATPSETTTHGVALIGLGVILAVNGMTRLRRTPLSYADTRTT